MAMLDSWLSCLKKANQGIPTSPSQTWINFIPCMEN